ncbi:MAG: helix-turn-helix domain-containing protein [Actinomycetia bacterium]|nr:helix-turn-helix domain-containing protein [Actinomycetes bacterium]
MVTVEVDSERVESRLAGGEVSCPSCPDGVLVRWGFARARLVVGSAEPVRPRRSRCRTCAVTHVLLPVTLLLRRAYVAELIWAAVVAKAAGAGHRVIAAQLRVPGSTVRGWLRVITSRAEVVRHWFVSVAVAAGVDVSIPKATGSGCGDVLAAVGAARSAIAARFGQGSVIGTVTSARVAVTCSGARLLAPGWPLAPGWDRPTPVDPDIGGVDGSSSRG